MNGLLNDQTIFKHNSQYPEKMVSLQFETTKDLSNRMSTFLNMGFSESVMRQALKNSPKITDATENVLQEQERVDNKEIKELKIELDQIRDELSATRVLSACGNAIQTNPIRDDVINWIKQEREANIHNLTLTVNLTLSPSVNK